MFGIQDPTLVLFEMTFIGQDSFVDVQLLYAVTFNDLFYQEKWSKLYNQKAWKKFFCKLDI